jgi:hypothetical protein
VECEWACEFWGVYVGLGKLVSGMVGLNLWEWGGRTTQRILIDDAGIYHPFQPLDLGT